MGGGESSRRRRFPSSKRQSDWQKTFGLLTLYVVSFGVIAGIILSGIDSIVKVVLILIFIVGLLTASLLMAVLRG